MEAEDTNQKCEHKCRANKHVIIKHRAGNPDACENIEEFIIDRLWLCVKCLGDDSDGLNGTVEGLIRR